MIAPLPDPAAAAEAVALDLDLPDEAATAALGARLAALWRAGDVVLLAGPLGAGKSALARAALRAAAGDPELEVPSPTFTLVQGYPLAGGITAWHFDLYRLAGADEVAELGWAEAREGVVLVEWPERLGALAPPEALLVRLDLVPGRPGARRARIVAPPAWTGRLAALAGGGGAP